MSFSNFRAYGKVCIHVGVWTLKGVCPLVGKVCVRIKLGAGTGVEVGVGARIEIRARIGVGFQLGSKAVWGWLGWEQGDVILVS